jgi:hypothetical protein
MEDEFIQQYKSLDFQLNYISAEDVLSWWAKQSILGINREV